MDYLVELNYLGVPARVKRLSESLFYGIREFYKEVNIDIEPGWHLVFLILKEEKEMSMLELSQSLDISKPAITKMIKKMERMEYIVISADSSDSRKKMVKLSEKSRKRLPEFERVWAAGQLSVQALLAGNEYFFEALEKFEQANVDLSFKELAVKNYFSE